MSRSLSLLCLLFSTLFAVSQTVVENNEKILVDQNQIYTALSSRDDVKLIKLAEKPNFIFSVRANSVLAPSFSEENPDIKTYDIVINNEVKGAFTYSPDGVWAYYQYNGQTISISPMWQDRSGQQLHQVKYGKQAVLPGSCGVDDHGRAIDFGTFRKLKNNRADLTEKRVYRMAVVATGEFTVANGGTVNSAKAAIAASVNGISEIYSKQFSIQFNLVSSFAYPNPATDPFIPDNAGGQGRTVQAGTQVPAAFPGANNTYDIGHVVHTHADGDNWSNGGLAQLESVCDNGTNSGALNKASGWSGSYSNDDFGWLSLFAHEVGHQFGMTHTFNGTGGACTDNISMISAVEIGSGTTIMSYNGVCQANNNVPSNGELDNYFHYVSAIQAAVYLQNLEIAGVSCANPTNTTNHHPEGTANPCDVVAYQIPKGTAFYLKAEATDEDGDPVYHAWEQFDEDGENSTSTQGRIGSQAASQKLAPLFKNIPPSLSNERYFPDILTVSKGLTNDPFQAVPTTNRTVSFAYSARDNKVSGGGIYYEELLIDVDNSGPLSITYPNVLDTLVPGEVFNTTWAVSGSEALCTNAEISLSTDGGITFPIVLATNVAYGTGSQSVTIPKTMNLTTTARIKVECIDYDCFKFYDISNANFRIESNCSAPTSIICPSVDLSFDKGDPGLDLNLEFKAGNKVSTFIKRVSETPANLGRVIMNNESFTGCADVSNYYFNTTFFSVDKSGTYSITVDKDLADGNGFVTIVNDEEWNQSFPCADGFIGSTAHQSGGGFINDGFTAVTLEECVRYRLIFYNFGDLPINTSVTAFTGPGNVVELFTAAQTANYTYTYIAVRNSDQIIAAHSPTADFTTLNGGIYTIYGFYYKTSGPTPPNNTDIQNYIGKKFIDFIVDGDCFIHSYNSFQLEVISDCAITNVALGGPGACNPLDNSFTQDIIVTYDGSPGGKIIANGQEFAVTTSPQTITFTGLSNGVQNFVEVYLDGEADCKTTVNFAAPQNCCPFNSGIPDDVSGCTGQPLNLIATPGLGSYEWRNDLGNVIDSDNQTSITTAGTVTLEITSPTGCSKEQEINVTFEQTPTIVLPADVTICDGVDFLINATTTSGNISWYKDGTLVQLGPNKTLIVDTSGVYKAVVGTGNCETEDEITVATKPAPQPSLGNDKKICEGQSTTLTVANEGTIQWFLNNTLISGQTGVNLVANQDGIYKVVVKGVNGCENEDEVVVTSFALPTVDAGANLEFCSGKSATINASSSSIIFNWYRNDQPINQSNLSFTVNQPGEYKIEALNPSNTACKAVDSINVIENLPPTANLGSDKVACIGSDVVIRNTVITGLTFAWTKGSTSLGSANEITVTTSGTYSVQVTDGKGCTAVDNVNVDFQPGPSVALNEVNIEFCEGQSFNVTATTTASKIEWQRNGTTIAGQTGKTLTVSQAGNYTILATGSLQGGSECTVEEEFTVVVNPVLALSVNDTTVCEGEAVTLSSNVNASKYTWTLNNQVVANTKTYKPTTAGAYTLEVETNKGCKSTDIINVAFSPRPGIGLDATGQYCKGDDLDINAQTDGTSFKWFRNNVAVPNATAKSLTVTQPGTYVFESSFNGLCPRKDTIIVSERPVPVVGLGQNVTICPGQNVTLDAQNPGADYNWSTGDTTQRITINNNNTTLQVRTIIVEVTNAFNCKSSDEIEITLRPKVQAKIESSATGICNGDSVTLTASGGLNYSWNGPAGTFELVDDDVLLVYPQENSLYTVIASDDCPGNRDTVEREVKFFTLKPASAGNDTCVIVGRSIRLKATGGIKYLWAADEAITSGINTSSPTVAPVEASTFVVTITDNNGCEQTDSVAVCIIEDPLKLIIPVEFITPNEDGFNDKLEFIGLEAFPDNSLLVYNRWGNIVFEKYRYQQDEELFDGTRNGEPLPPDTYYYVLKFDEYVFKQALTIVREK